MKTWTLILFVASCGTSQAPSEELPQNPSENVTELAREAATATVEESDVVVENDELPEALPPIEGPRNFVTPHHCHPPGPCTLEFETLRGVQHIDVGHGHSTPPQLTVALRVGEGSARLEGIQATLTNEVRGTVVARSRDSLEGGAFYVTLDGDASAVHVDLVFLSE